MTAWVQVLVTMADGPSLPIRGVIRQTPDKPERINFAYVGQTPMFVGVGGDDVRIWRDRSKVRVENLDGHPLFITDGENAWRFDQPGQPPLRSTAERVRYLGTGSELLVNRPAHDWLGEDYTRPAGPIEDLAFLGRDCWSVDLLPPPRKTGLLRMVVDRETGAVLQSGNVGEGGNDGNDGNAPAEIWVRYVELTVGDPIDPELFTWSGPTRDFDEDRRGHAALHRAEQDRKREWFRTNISDTLPVLRVPLPLRIEELHTLDEETGAFQASMAAGFASGMLARRPRSDEPWNLRWHGSVHRWSTEGFDWAATLHGVDLDPDALAALQAALHPGEAAKAD
ncbi:hypothetical protein [Prescottella defluvii]|uniref:hypothetical protein n=1 Tax=Prescottella defluvii TaxID=1323361 RepID=UPI0004F3A604|nr:hypothetical protein [Prescottella defluvii]